MRKERILEGRSLLMAETKTKRKNRCPLSDYRLDRKEKRKAFARSTALSLWEASGKKKRTMPSGDFFKGEGKEGGSCQGR